MAINNDHGAGERAEQHETERIEFFSDAVFAIIMTLLVLDLHVPIVASGSSTADFFAALVPLVPKFVGFALSFLTIAIFWVNHHSFFETVAKTDGGLLWHNNHLLFWLCFVPFPTAFLGEHPLDAVPEMLYGICLFFAASSFYLLRDHARHSKLLKPRFQKEFGNKMERRGLPAIILYGLSIPFAFINPYISLTLFFVVQLMYFMPQDLRELSATLDFDL